MATRLQADEPGKDSKWADIDDDEDDWAPETVEWMDGTKSNVGADPQPLAVRQEDQPPALVNENQPAEAVKPVLTSLHKPTISQTTKTILRPGAQISASPKPGVLQNAGSDKSASGNTKIAPPPSKSPWAVLPSVEKFTPINPPIQPSQRPFQRDPQGFDALPPAPSPAMEVAADDFSRQWRDDRGMKELFNAHSGRYEPAADIGRRGSRQEHGHRQPAVLQRPPQGSMSNGPAEPSAAFQTARTSAEGGAPWSRRRASSSLSAAGGRRPSLSLSQDLAQYPPAEVAVESPRSSFVTVDRPGPWVRGSQPPTQPPLAEDVPPSEESQQPMEDPVAKQQRLMKEKIELARLAKQKRQEAEAAEEEARKERLKLKMAQLAVASPSPDINGLSSKDVSSSAASVQPPKSNTVSPPKPPVPTHEGEIAQYGMMKVHQPHPVKKNFVSEAALIARSNHDANASHDQSFRGSVSPNKAIARPTQPQQQPPTSRDRTQQPKRLPDAPGSTAAPLEKLGGSWKASPSSNDYNWGPNTMNARTTVGASVWGPPALSNEKSLGNGTFESKFSHPNFQGRLDNRFDDNRRGGLPAQGLMHGPIGSGIKGNTPPTSSHRQSHFTQTFQNLSAVEQQEQLTPGLSAASPQPSPSVDDQAFASAHLDASLQQSIAQTSSLHPQTAQPLASSSSSYPNMASVSLPPAPTPTSLGLHGEGKPRLGTQAHSNNWIETAGRSHDTRDRKAGISDWRAFPEKDRPEKEGHIAKYQHDLAASGGAQPKPKASEIITYRIYRDAGGKKIDLYHITVYPDGQKTSRRENSYDWSENNANMVKKSQEEHPEDHPGLKVEPKIEPKLEPKINGPPAAAASSSRYFRSGELASVPQTATIPNIAIADNEAPPPAEQGLFELDEPKVKIPKPARVKLPGQTLPLPPRSLGLDKTFQGPATLPPAAPKQGPMRTLMHADDLKAKFGHLHPGAPFANTKPAFDVTSANVRPNSSMPRVNPNSAAVTAIANKALFAVDTSSAPASKPIAEDDDCFDFPDFGSKPTVRVPTIPHQNHQFGYSHDSGMLAPNMGKFPRYQKFVETQSIPGDSKYLFPLGNKVAIKVAGMEKAKLVDATFKRRAPGQAAGALGASAGTRGSFRNTASSGSFSPNYKSRGNNNAGGFLPKGKGEGASGPLPQRGNNNNKTHKHAAATASSSGTSSPKPRGWAPRATGQVAGAASGN
jgi:hypothetical protein